MKAKRGYWIALWLIGLVVTAVLVIVFWPTPDPLAGVETVALRLGDDPESENIGSWFEDKLKIVLNDRNITIVADESQADAVLAVDDITLNLGDVEFSFSGGQFHGRAHAVCALTDARTGERHLMDFYLRFEDERVSAKLNPRKFWQFWK